MVQNIADRQANTVLLAGQAVDPSAGARRAREVVLGGELRLQAQRLRTAYRVD